MTWVKHRCTLQKHAILCNPARTNNPTKTNKHVQSVPKSSPTKTNPACPPQHRQLMSTHSKILEYRTKTIQFLTIKIKNLALLSIFPSIAGTTLGK